MKKIIAILISIAMCATFAPMVGASDENITVTLTPSGTADITVNQTTWTPVAGLGTNEATGTEAFNLTSVGTVPVNVTVLCANSTSGDWEVASTPGHNQFNMSIYAAETSGAWALLSWDTPVDVVNELSVSAGGQHWSLFGLQVYMPTTSSTDAEQEVIITFTATVA